MRETPQAARAFEDYYDLGEDRSLRKLADSRGQEEGKRRARLATLEQWSSKHHWQERIIQRDREKAAAKRKKHDADIEAMNERHVLIATTHEVKAIKQIEVLTKGETFSASAAVRLLDITTKLERLARGAPTENVEQSSQEQLEQEWIILRETIFKALEPYPEARLAVARALLALDKHDDHNAGQRLV
jgi:hypothetical protein